MPNKFSITGAVNTTPAISPRTVERRTGNSWKTIAGSGSYYAKTSHTRSTSVRRREQDLS